MRRTTLTPRLLALLFLLAIGLPPPIFALRLQLADAAPGASALRGQQQEDPSQLAGLEEALKDPDKVLRQLAQLVTQANPVSSPLSSPAVHPEPFGVTEGKLIEAAGLEEPEPIATNLSAQEVVELLQEAFRRSKEAGKSFGVQIPVEGVGLVEDEEELRAFLLSGPMLRGLQRDLEDAFREGQRYEVRETNYPSSIHYDIALVFSDQALQANAAQPLAQELQRFVQNSFSFLEPGAKWTNRGDMHYSLKVTLDPTKGQSRSADVLHVRLSVGPTLKLEDRRGRPYGEVFELLVWAGVQRSANKGWDEKQLLEEHVNRDEVVEHLEIGILRLKKKYPDYFKSQDAGLEERRPTSKEATSGAGREVPAFAGMSALERMPQWLKELVTPQELFERIHRGHEALVESQPVAVLFDPGLIPGEDDWDRELLLLELKRQMQSVFALPEEVRFGLGLRTGRGEWEVEFRIVEVVRHPEGKEGPLPIGALPLVVTEALASPWPLFYVDPLIYAGLDKLTLPDALADLTDLFT